jgi:hypothetical protein
VTTLTLDEALVEGWQQTLIQDAKSVDLGTERYAVWRTPKHGLRQVDFVFDGNEIRGLEQNSETTSRRAEIARSGKERVATRRRDRWEGYL